MASKRYVARQILHTNNVHLATVAHELWRLEKIEAAAFTEKEQAWLRKTNQQLKEVSQRLTKLGNKLQKSP